MSGSTLAATAAIAAIAVLAAIATGLAAARWRGHGDRAPSGAADLDVTDPRAMRLLEAAPDAMVCVTEDGRIRYVNAATEELFGHRRGELIGRQVETLVPEGNRPVHQRDRARYLSDPVRRPMGIGLKVAGRRRDGSVFPAEIALAPLHAAGGSLTIAAIRDVTDRVASQQEQERLMAQADRAKLEAQIAQSARLESLGRLAGGVAHDFNNLLGVISNYSSFIKQALADADSDTDLRSLHDDIEQVERAARRAAGLTRQLLAFAGREAGQAQALSLNEVITDLEQFLARTLGEDIELTTSLDPEASRVLADASQLEQVIVNLAINSRDAMPDGGRLAIETASTDLDEASASSAVGLRPGRYVALKVSDTGMGISPDVIDHVFEPFFTTKLDLGTGLGLATVYGIVTGAGGNVQINSEPGLGTTVTVLLPVTGVAARRTAPLPRKFAGGRGQAVLLVEDEAALREVIRRILSRNDYRVLPAASGREALEIAATEPGDIDVLLADVVMPQMQGQELAAKVRQLRPDIQVLFMSGYTKGLLGTQGVVEPGVDLIEKPFSEPALMARLTEILQARESPARPER
jgi:PAS domain S-box-containing protein